ncbi:Rab GTPase [Pelomyxa schiedti]|nr:Rab GTPase [Pelomyxa schiedti]
MGFCNGNKAKKQQQLKDKHAQGVRVGEKRPVVLEKGVKLVLVGDSNTGKTCIVERLCRNDYEKTTPTIGASFQVHRVPVDDRDVKLEIWDTAGQERYRSLTPMYFRGASAAIVVYDITSADSYEVMQRWVDELKVRAQPNIILAIAGNKLDLADHRVVPTATAQEYVRQLAQSGAQSPIFMECSAKTGQNIKQLFDELGHHLVQAANSGLL